MSVRDGVPAAMAAASRAADSELVTTRTSARTVRGVTGVPLLLRGADGAAVAQFTVVDAEIEPAFRIAAGPRFVGDRRAVAAVVTQWKQRPCLTLLTRWKLDSPL